MSLKPAKMQFNGGELSPWLEGRTDIAKYDKTAKLCRNFIPIAEGSLKRRGGTRFVAQTPEDPDVLFEIRTVPAEAEVMINGEKNNSIYLSRGDEVYYEVKADGYAAKNGKLIVNEDKILWVYLVSLTETYTLKINPIPEDATVKINGYERREFQAKKNSSVSYIVKKEGYELKSDTILLDRNREIDVVLEKGEEETSAYGDWGKPLAFIACTVYGDCGAHQKCILIYFENGYLPVLFNANNIAPTRINASLFIYNKTMGYNSVVPAYGVLTLAKIQWIAGNLYYTDLKGNTIVMYIPMVLSASGWPYDESGNYASIYKQYDGNVVGSVVKIYYKGNLVWTLKGR